MPRGNTTAGIGLSLLFLSFASTSSFANPATEAIKEWFERLRGLGASTATYERLEERDPDGATLIGATIKFPLVFDLPAGGNLDAAITIRIPETHLSDVEPVPEGLNIGNWEAPGTAEFHAKGAIVEKGRGDTAGKAYPFNIVVKQTDALTTDYFLPAFPRIDDDPNKPISRYFEWLRWAVAIRGSEASSKNLEIFSKEMPDGSQSYDRYEDIRSVGISNGQIETYSIGNFISEQTFSIGDGANAVDMTIRQEAENSISRGLDIKPILRAFSIMPADDANQEGTILETSEINGVSVSFHEGKAAIQRIGMGGFSLDPAAKAFDLGEFLDSIALGELENASEEELIAKARDGLALLGGMSLSYLDIDAVAVEATNLNGVIESMGGQGLSYEGVERAFIRGVSFKGPDDISFGLKRFELSGLELAELPRYVDLVVASAGGHEPGLYDILPVIPRLGRLDIEGLDITAPDVAENISLENYRFSASGFIDPIPTEVTSRTDKLSFPISLLEDEDARALLEGMGITQITYDDELRINWDEETQDLTLERLSFEMKDGIKARADLVIGGIPRLAFERPDQAQAALATATIKGGTIEISDARVIAAMMEKEAAKANMSTDTLAHGLADQAQNALGAAADTDFGNSLREAVRTFLTNQKRIELSIKPDSPVPLAQVIGMLVTAPDQLPEILGLEIKAAQ
ncbi:hypothetical protein HPQ64_14545 [Rhizobiales bacterium]|uniref:hypothetical protein n=1 Tax=Hongsoonwoonella zoysiae TaxID=2821844 RepID=UPI0015603263|nr:hypothetical protein [Hongsoonwoonella zoysiae]NRG18909.1 hypothetical protein [Hongsoonwoonella zoysiae]